MHVAHPLLPGPSSLCISGKREHREASEPKGLTEVAETLILKVQHPQGKQKWGTPGRLLGGRISHIICEQQPLQVGAPRDVIGSLVIRAEARVQDVACGDRQT